ncbi:MAG: LysR family transcriptional regulator [Halomonas sp.]|uniref:LysR family transcriptional regulator n=1 Tax=Halomonas sp. TaxID=1486246 RepID=UPI0017BD3E0E|nr:LysR family transcriptional regulator [Halomonas sp.]NWN82115.1 LysR family transcriptional regulator [Halomonas sp.]
MHPELKIQPLRYVLAIVDEGGFHAAARHLHRTQPALSMAVRDLEQRLGEPLFEKGGKATLTPFGAYCLPRFRELVTQHDRVSRDLVARVEKRTGHIDMAAVPSVASRLMPRLLSDFIQHYPDLRVSLHDGNADFVGRLVASGEVDLGISSLWQADEGLDFCPLIHDAIGVVCRDDHRFADRRTLSWQELEGEVLIRNGTSRLLSGTDAEPLLAQSAFDISNMISLTAMLEAGIGITTLPRLAFPEEYARLRFVPLSPPHLERQIGLICRTEGSLSPAAAAMRQHLIENLGNQGNFHSRSR